jgi:hypothetical protein
MKIYKLFSTNADQKFAPTYAIVIAFATFYILTLVNNSLSSFAAAILMA